MTQDDPGILNTPEKRAAAEEDNQAQNDAFANLQEKMAKKPQDAPPEVTQTVSEPTEPPPPPAPAPEATPAPPAASALPPPTVLPPRTLGVQPSTVAEAPPPEPRLSDRARQFACPSMPNGSVLAVVGRVVRIPDATSPNGFKELSREGDKKVKFTGGTSELIWDLDVIEWLEKNPAKYRDVEDPETLMWYDLSAAQHPTSTEEATMPPGLNIADAIAGKTEGGLTGHSPVAAARKRLQESRA